MNKGQWTAAGIFLLSLIFLAASFFADQSTFFENPTVHIWGPIALISGLIAMGEEMWRGASLAESTWPLVRAVVVLLILIGGLWFVTHQPLQIFPAHVTGSPRSGSWFLPNIFR